MTTPTPSPAPAQPPREMTRSELDRAGLLHAEPGVHISRFAIFVPADALGEPRPITVRSGAVIHGGTVLAEQSHVEEHAVVGKPELGYAVSRIYPGAGAGDIAPVAAIEAALDPRGLIARDPKSRTGETIRVIGYSPTAGRVLLVVLLPHEHPPRGLWHVVAAWPAARQWREAYAAEDEEA